MSKRSSKKPLSRAARVMPLILAGMLLTACGGNPDDMVKSAQDYIQKKDYNAAVIQLKNALQKNAELTEARYLLGKIYFERGDMADAAKELRHAISLGYQGEDAIPMLARALIAQGQREEVIKTYSSTSLKDPVELSKLLTVLGDARSRDKRGEAERDYRAAIKANPSNAHAKVGLARLQALAGNFNEAVRMIDAVIAESPDLVDAYELKGNALLGARDADGAMAAFHKAIGLAPKQQQLYVPVVTTLLQTNRVDEARQELAAMEKAVGKSPAVWYLQAYLDFRTGKLEAARDAVQEVIGKAPDYMPARLLAGAVFYRLNDQLQAQANLNKVLEVSPGNPVASRWLVMSFIAQRDAERALKALEPLLKKMPDSPDVLRLAGQANLLAGNLDKAAEFFGRQVERAPDDARALTRLAITRLASGEVDKGLEELSTASSLDEKQTYPDFARITVLLLGKKFDEALKAQETLEKKLPNNPLTYNLRGGIMLGKGDPEAAAKAFRRSLEVDPDFLPAATNLARLEVKKGDVPAARKLFTDMLARNKQRPDVYFALAQLEEATDKNPEKVKQYLQGAVDAAPDQAAPKLRMADFMLRTNARTEALAMVRDAAALEPTNPAVQEMLGRALMANGDLEQAATAFRKWVDTRPEDAGAWLDLGRVLQMSGDGRAAVEALQKSLELNPANVETYRFLIGQYVKNKQYGKAVDTARQLQKAAPKLAQGYLFEADVLTAKGDGDAALAMFRKAHETAPSSATLIKLHDALSRSQRTDEAAKLMADWLKKSPKDTQVTAYMADYYLSRKQLDKAFAQYQKLDELEPNRAGILNNLAWVANELGDPRAMGYGKRAIELSPESAAILDTVGMIEVGHGDAASGVTKMEKAVSLAPKTPALKLNLAKGYIAAKRKDDARKILDQLVTDYPVGTSVHDEAVALRGGL
ncbi:PEP-CTERM system TPR-repeat protein PrsT [Nitrogeniibacter mangrovi]|uniref:PEP-CTERM system TPR-repeat protein PrsT n=1 Tax=Nitrogeniibacter mangrovi TaxID=2016596 RepID=A0A6C1B930_9RHOO|nr:XrtA/PEP-CTERM system TPR-repeat protein PrsT [Nitrogeniibacter mangrovi]QID18744.1 PEP-CTERM system TPR-repeat protein PrsT [Nitrogeniibacter mangrovi]